MKIKELTAFLETIAPLSYQEDYDNSGLLVGDPGHDVQSALLSLDCTEAVIDEAVRKGCGIVIAHHPVIFRGLKSLTGRNYVERTVMSAIRNNVAVYAIHTNLDSIRDGVNAKICEKLGITDFKVLSPKSNLLRKLVTFCPTGYADCVREALFSAGAGHIGDYSGCSFNSDGFGTYTGAEGTAPFAGEPGKPHREPEVRIDTVFPAYLETQVLSALIAAHPYEEVAYDIFPLATSHSGVGSGMIGTIRETDELEFLRSVKEKLGASVIRHTPLRGKTIRRIAVCGGSGSFLLKKAIAAGADMFITADYKYHEFFDAEGKIVIADVGHFESEQFTKDLLHDIIRKKFSTFALHLTEINTNPITYLI
jgi:dinuclear metal center YbgI/SA1388 family protein